MHIKKLFLCNFRNHKKAEFSFSPHINWIWGENGSGKTNLLEAISLLTTGKSFRTRYLENLIHHEANFFLIEAEIFKDGIDQTIQVFFTKERKEVKYNQTTSSQLCSLLGLLPSVLFVPEDHDLIAGEPNQRRTLFNLHLSQIDPSYVHHLFRYHRAMKQRNFLLRKKTEKAIDSWENIMAHSAEYLIQKRMEAISALHPKLSHFLEKISSRADQVELKYIHSFQVKKEKAISAILLEQYQKNRRKEIQMGRTLFGPHVEDFQITLNKKLAKTYGSEGQKRSIIAALKLSQWHHFSETFGEMPLLCFDDFAIHFDSFRQDALHQEIANLGQVFLTSPHAPSKQFADQTDHLLGVGEKTHLCILQS
ncbi:MAG: DNA replication/repair protein RecF [Chlamydiae bacterium]|nr:DNA replication/repair protein RecF [Chlamydiota bacterium]